MPEPVRLGDRFRTTRSSEVHVTYVQYAPSHTVGGKAELPAGTTVVALDQAPNATAFYAYPEAYDELAAVLVPDSESSSRGYASAHGLSFRIDDIGDLLEPLTPWHRGRLRTGCHRSVIESVRLYVGLKPTLGEGGC